MTAPTSKKLRRPVIVEIDLNDSDINSDTETESTASTHVSCSEDDPEPLIPTSTIHQHPSSPPKEPIIEPTSLLHANGVASPLKPASPDVLAHGNSPDYKVDGYDVIDASSQVLLASVPSISTLMTSCMSSPGKDEAHETTTLPSVVDKPVPLKPMTSATPKEKKYKVPKQGLLASLCQQTTTAKVRVGLSKRFKVEPLHDKIRRK